MSRRILAICGHPRNDSLCGALTHAYAEGAKAGGHDCRVLMLADLAFDPILRGRDHRPVNMEPDLLAAQESIRWAEHLVWAYPTWWGSMPALLKGFIDRAFVPGFAFKYREKGAMWDRLLAGRSARLLVTMDAPWWWDTFMNRATSRRTMSGPILNFSGVRPVRSTVFDQVRKSPQARREAWLELVRALGSEAQ